VASAAVLTGGRLGGFGAAIIEDGKALCDVHQVLDVKRKQGYYRCSCKFRVEMVMVRLFVISIS
jgi:hypothetical protein